MIGTINQNLSVLRQENIIHRKKKKKREENWAFY